LVSSNDIIITLGNKFRGDDGAGSLFGNIIRGHVPWEVFDGGDAPENITGLILKSCPETILIVDAMDFSGSPGDFKLVTSNDLGNFSISTHGALKPFVDYLKMMTGAKLHILGFQPKRLGLEYKISPEVSESVRKAAKIFMKSENLSQVLQKLHKK